MYHTAVQVDSTVFDPNPSGLSHASGTTVRRDWGGLDHKRMAGELLVRGHVTFWRSLQQQKSVIADLQIERRTPRAYNR